MAAKQASQPRVVVFSTLFPHPGQPNAGLFIRERMFRVGKKLPLVVVAPVPWFPFQGFIRRFRPGYRPAAPHFERQDGVEVYHPRFLAVPGFFRSLDGRSMAVCSVTTIRKLKRRFRFNLIDAHFAYPDGYAATLLGKWFKVPVTITLRGTEVPLSRTNRRRHILRALQNAARVFSVADALKRHVVDLGADGGKIRVIGNGVDAERFQPLPKQDARARLGIPLEAKVLISVGGLVERKGFHRVIECLPRLRQTIPNLHFLVVGGASGEGDWSQRLQQQVQDLELEECVHFLGPLPPDELKVPLSAADVFVLATRNEGWANVFLEAMACGLPVVTTDVGGNAEVVCKPELGTLVPFGDHEQLLDALRTALEKEWENDSIRQYALVNSWESRVKVLEAEFNKLVKAATFVDKHTVMNGAD